MNAVFVSAGSAVLTWVLCFPTRRLLLRRNIMDRPSNRSSHMVATPRGGGIAVIASLLLTLVLLRIPNRDGPGFWILMGMLTIVLVSFTDDIRSLSPSLRLLFQSAAAIAVLFALHWRYSHLVGGGPLAITVIVCGEFLWLVGYTNAFNFMDGINGLAAGQAVVTGLGSYILIGLGSSDWLTAPTLIYLTVACASAGFLPHNAVRPKLFMGDVGSASLGFLLAGLTLWTAHYVRWSLLPPLLLLHANFVLDTSLTMARRIFRGEPWREPHREHFYQRLVRSGSTHASVTSVEMLLQIVVLGLALLYLRADSAARLTLGAIVVGIWLCFFNWANRRFLFATATRDAEDRGAGAN
jgi:UDP-GlcNAc:undecaprenyl-phosphate GlcNAc-1-phosphate transferase